METQNIFNFFTKHEMSLLGVCSKLAKKLKLSPLVVRIAFIVLTFIFIPLGIVAYLGLYLLFKQNNSKVIIFSIFGAILGVPLSYYFQADTFKHFGGGLSGSTGMFGYVRGFIKNVERFDKYTGNGWDVVFNLLLSVVIFAALGGLLGYFINNKENVKTQ